MNGNEKMEIHRRTLIREMILIAANTELGARKKCFH